MTAYYDPNSQEATPIIPASVHGTGVQLGLEYWLSRSGSSGQSSYRSYLKRWMDIALILLSAPLVLPIVALCALFVALEGGNPFYIQTRIGKNGNHFKMWKLRSMVVDADAKLQAYLDASPEARLEWDTTQKLKSDPRITLVGRILRKSSMDELPQLWNVLRGEMSLVGPRPMLPSQKSLYPGHAYYRMLPGLTGSWQISARNDSSFADRALFDRSYEQNLSFGTDLRIIASTFRVVVRATGY